MNNFEVIGERHTSMEKINAWHQIHQLKMYEDNVASTNKCPVTANYIKKSARSHYIGDFYMPSAIDPPLNIRCETLSLIYLVISLFCSSTNQGRL